MNQRLRNKLAKHLGQSRKRPRGRPARVDFNEVAIEVLVRNLPVERVASWHRCSVRHVYRCVQKAGREPGEPCDTLRRLFGARAFP